MLYAVIGPGEHDIAAVEIEHIVAVPFSAQRPGTRVVPSSPELVAEFEKQLKAENDREDTIITVPMRVSVARMLIDEFNQWDEAGGVDLNEFLDGLVTALGNVGVTVVSLPFPED